jgi:predicted RNA-binding Zn-ribbon protein involved in translation (DUF1610 family)
MHQFRSRSTILRFKAASLLLSSRCLLAPLAGVTVMYAVLQFDRKLTYVAIGMGIAAALATIFQWILAARTRCPLCLAPVLASRFKNTFHCPYCGEKSAMKVRSRRR